jgi:hypothetical protein
MVSSERCYQVKTCEIWSSYDSKYEDDGFLGYDAV